MAKPFCYFDTTISNKAADSSDRPKTIKLTDKDHTDCCLQLNASYVRDNYLYRATSLHKKRLYAKARKDNYTNGDRSISPTIYPFGMNAQGGFCDLAVLSLKQMANKKFKDNNSYTLIGLSQYLEIDVADGVTNRVLSLQILKAYKNFIYVNSSSDWWVYGDFVLCLGGRVEFCKMYLNIIKIVFP